MTPPQPVRAGAALRSEVAKLVSQLAAGDMDAAAEFYDRYAAQVFGLARRILQNEADAEDVVQDAFSQAWRNAARLDHASPPRLGSTPPT